jgi:hypothetical protein
MVVQSVNAEKKLVTVLWFSDTRQKQEGVFPAGALDRVEAAPVQTAAVKGKPAASGAGAPLKRGRKA